MPLPYSEKTTDLEYSIQRLNADQMIAILKKLTDKPLTDKEKIEIDRVIMAIENPTPLKEDIQPNNSKKK